MKKNVIKKSFILLIISSVLMCILSTISFADTQQIDLSNLDTIPETTATPTPTPTPTPKQTTTKTTSQSKNTALPKTGSNVEVIFVVGLVGLASVSIYMYKKKNIF